MNGMKPDRRAYLFSNKVLATLILPLIVEQLLAVSVGIAASIMVASVGEAAVSGVSLVDQIMVLLINLFAALATGGAVVAGQYLGQGKQEAACKASNQLVWFVTMCSIVITAMVYVGHNFILRVVFGNIDAEVMMHAKTYLIIVTASIPFIALYNGCAAIFRAMGNSKITMLVSIIMNIINISGNAILIYGLHRGTEGVAIPTLVSRAVAAILVTILLCNQKRLLHIQRTFRFQLDGKMIKRILYIGIPSGMENSMFQLGKILVLSLISTFGTYAIAANAVSNAVAMIQILPGMAITLAVTTVIARCVGAGDYEQVHYYTKKLNILTILAQCVSNGIIFLLLPFILQAYNLSDLTARTALHILLFHAVMSIIIWPFAFTLPATLRAAGDVKFTMGISIISMWVFRIVLSYVLAGYMGLGVFGVWVAMVIDWCFRAICFIIRYVRGKWKYKCAV